jgi:hypothetical protein
MGPNFDLGPSTPHRQTEELRKYGASNVIILQQEGEK